MFTQRLRKVYADGVLPTRARKPCVNQISQGLRKVYAQGNLLMMRAARDIINQHLTEIYEVM
jgi:hypothetical protein